MRVEIHRLQDRLGITSIYVTHDQVEAMTLADRVVVMNHGVIEQVGPPTELYHRPATRFVAGFMGDAAFLPVAAGQTELGPCTAPDGTLLVVRPHDVMPTADGLATIVRGAEFHGPTRTYRLVLPSGTEILATVAHTVHAAPGSELRVALRPGDHAVVPA